MASIAFVESNRTGTGFEALRAAKARGLHVLFLTDSEDRYRAVADGEEVFAACVDEVIECDTASWPQMRETVEALGERGDVAGVTTLAEYHVPLAARAARALGLPGLSPEAADIARDKAAGRRACEARGIGVGLHATAAQVDEVEGAISIVGLPCVVKPPDESASVGVSLCQTVEEAQAAVARVVGRKTNRFGQPPASHALLEEYMLGCEASVECFCVDGRSTVLGVTDTHLGKLPYFTELGHTFPSGLPTSVTDQLAASAVEVLDAYGFDFGPAHLEFRVTDSGPRLIELNARVPGDFIPTLVERATGVSIIDRWLDLVLGEVPTLARTSNGGAAIRFIDSVSSGESRARSWEGRALAQRVPGVTDVSLVDLARVSVDAVPATNSHERLGHVIAQGESGYAAGLAADLGLAQITVA